MIRFGSLQIAAAILAAAAPTLCAQGIAGRVDGAPDGRVQFTFASRPGICGIGRFVNGEGLLAVTTGGRLDARIMIRS